MAISKRQDDPPPVFPIGKDPPYNFHLKTRALQPTPPGIHSKDSLYVAGLHTGAGESVLVLTDKRDDAAKGYLVGANLRFEGNSPFTFGFDMKEPDNHASWGNVVLGFSKGDAGFYVDRSSQGEQKGIKFDTNHPILHTLEGENRFKGWIGESNLALLLSVFFY